MSLQEAFERAEAPYIGQILADTWGCPQPGIKYPFYLMTCASEDGLRPIIRSETHSDCGNPFFWDDMQEWLFDLDLEEGQVYQWEGYYIKYKNGNYRFTGKLKRLKVMK